MYSCLSKTTWCMLGVKRPKYSYTLRSVHRLPDISSINKPPWYWHTDTECMSVLCPPVENKMYDTITSPAIWPAGSNFRAILLCNALCTPQSHLTSQWLGLSHEMVERFANVASVTDIHNRAQLMTVYAYVCVFGCVEALGPSLPLSRELGVMAHSSEF